MNQIQLQPMVLTFFKEFQNKQEYETLIACDPQSLKYLLSGSSQKKFAKLYDNWKTFNLYIF